MKLTFLLIFISLMQVSATIYSQNTKFTFKADNKQIVEVLKEIEDNSNFRFFYLREQVDVERKVSITANDATVEQILDELFKGREISYELMNDFLIVLSKNDNELRDSGANYFDYYQQRTVSGKITDSGGQPLPGVSIVIKGTTQGTITDSDGEYSLSNIPTDAVLVFSFVGMRAQEINVGSQTNINVVMEEETISVEEVVAVGYGTQKKINLSGSVSSVAMNQLEKKTNVSQTSQLLAGEIGGLTTREEWGKPGRDESTLVIRGLGTFSGAGNNPLVIVDGIQSSIDDVNPNDIASISVLKDAASASIYGSRAANGVIIIDTKRGKAGAMQVRYESQIGIQDAELPEYLNSWEYAEAYNMSRVNQGYSPLFSEEVIAKFKSGEDPDNYPNKQHVKDLFTSGNGLQTKHNITFSGGSDNLRYLLSTGYLKKNGLVAKNSYDRYDILVNINSNLHENLVLNASIKGIRDIIKEPAINSAATNFNYVITTAVATPNTSPGRRSDGSYGMHMGSPPAQAGLDGDSFTEEFNNQFNGNMSLEWSVIKSLKVTGRAGYNLGYWDSKHFVAEMDFGRGFTRGPTELEIENRSHNYLSLEALIDYDKTFGSHNVHLLAGFSQEESNSTYLSASRDNFPVTTLPYLDVGSPANDENSGGESTWKIRSYFGRLNYIYKERYLLEGNLRYDGSSRFSEGNRFGFFPSFSAGWIISEESFFDIQGIESLKLRGSFGVLGNQQIGTYPYQKTLSLGWDFYQGDVLQPGVRLSRLPTQDISWETTEIINGGIDANLFGGKLNLIVDYYYKKTFDILYNLSVSEVLGMGVGDQNAGEVENRGWDFELTYRDRIGEFSFNIHPVFSIVQNKVTNLANVDQDIGQGLFIGEPLNSYYGYETDGLFVDQQDIDNYATQNYNAKPGFIRYKDINGPEGVPDNKVDSRYDRTVLGSSFPPYNYGLGISLNYKSFDFYIQGQGLGGMYRRINSKALAIYNEGNVERWHWEERWTEENPDRYAKYPLFIAAYGLPIFEDVNSYWLRNASFLRIKNITLGYSLPPRLLNTIFLDKLRIYVTGRNVFCFDNHAPGWDPEMTYSEGYNKQFHPPTRVYSVGLNVNF